MRMNGTGAQRIDLSSVAQLELFLELKMWNV